ncbi:hypothetical protein [Sunxiuqinia rutila]|uniref:hypothetical protein n=1 Tax=Sunxiuqinia rutila TaxID=1397841 RepID=UPI003D35B47F
MKKQILFLTFLVLVALLNVNHALAQGPVTGTIATPIIADGNPNPYVDYLATATPATALVTDPGCLQGTSSLTPQVGATYTYEVTVSDPGNDRIHWFVTDEVNILAAINNITGTTVDQADGSEYIMTAGTEYNNATNTDNTIDISWNAFTTTDPVLLVTYVVDAAGCTDNIKVYRIEPKFKFTLDLAAYTDETGSSVVTDGSGNDCVSPIESATFSLDADGSGTQGLIVDYGENWIFFSVSAAYFSHSWQPSFRLNYAGQTSEVLEVYWNYEDQATASAAGWNAVTESTTGSGIYDVTAPVLIQNSDGTDDGTGESIVVAVRVDHGTVENPEAGDRVLTFAVNGTMYNGTDYSDSSLDDLGPDTLLADGTSGTDGECDQVDFDDETTFTLTPRPSVQSNTPASSTDATLQLFVPVNP